MKKWLFAILLLTMAQTTWGAICSVSEFRELITDGRGKTIDIPLVVGLSPTTQLVTATTATAVANAFATSTRFLWVYCDEVMNMQLGTAPATGLTTADFRIPSGGFWIGLRKRDVDLGTLKIAFCDIDCA